jgi:hypothetical protein
MTWPVCCMTSGRLNSLLCCMNPADVLYFRYLGQCTEWPLALRTVCSTYEHCQLYCMTNNIGQCSLWLTLQGTRVPFPLIPGPVFLFDDLWLWDTVFTYRWALASTMYSVLMIAHTVWPPHGLLRSQILPYSKEQQKTSSVFNRYYFLLDHLMSIHYRTHCIGVYVHVH